MESSLVRISVSRGFPKSGLNGSFVSRPDQSNAELFVPDLHGFDGLPRSYGNLPKRFVCRTCVERSCWLRIARRRPKFESTRRRVVDYRPCILMDAGSASRVGKHGRSAPPESIPDLPRVC